MSSPLVSLESVVKTFGRTRAVDGVTLQFGAGEVHGLVGENGAGKSTVVKMLAGLHRPDGGVFSLDGRPVVLHGPRDALAKGLCYVSQELTLVPARTVAENVFLGHTPARAGLVQHRAVARAYESLVVEAGIGDVPGRAKVGSLSLAQRQQVEILRALARKPRLLVLDEPTAVLSTEETERLLALMRRLANAGTAVVLVSHFLTEVLGVADVVTVMRDGKVVNSGPASTQTPTSLVRDMVGRALDVIYPEPPPRDPTAPTVLEVRGMRRGRSVRGIDLDVHAGEIVGLAGLIGSGRTELARLIFGADQAEGGSVTVNGKRLRRPSPRAAMDAGVAMLPESRKDEGLVLVRSVRENLTLASLSESASGGFVRPTRDRVRAEELAERYDVRMPRLGGPVWQLSGGNQQKVLFGKWLVRRPSVFIADEPTRGVDIAAKVQIHRFIHELAASGAGVLLISSEVEEVLGLSHRVLVLRHGAVVAEFPRQRFDRETVLEAAFSDVRQEVPQ